MDILDINTIIFVSIPEAMMMSVLGLFLIGKKIKFNILFLAGLGQALSSFLVRLLPISFGFHVFIQLITHSLILKIVTGLKYRFTVVAFLFGTIIYLVVESTNLLLISSLTSISVEQIIELPHLRIIAFIPQFTAMLLIYLFCRRFNCKIFDIS